MARSASRTVRKRQLLLTSPPLCGDSSQQPERPENPVLSAPPCGPPPRFPAPQGITSSSQTGSLSSQRRGPVLAKPVSFHPPVLEEAPKSQVTRVHGERRRPPLPAPPRVAGRGAGLEGLTCTDQGTVVVQGPEVRPGQRQERVQLAEVIPEAGPRQDRADDNVAQRMANEAGWRQKQCGWAWQREAARGSCTGPWGGPPSTSHWLQGPGQQNVGSGPSSAGFPAPAMPSLPRDLREWKPPCPVRSEEKLGFLLVLHY